jgi:hypothetical protein
LCRTQQRRRPTRRLRMRRRRLRASTRVITLLLALRAIRVALVVGTRRRRPLMTMIPTARAISVARSLMHASETSLVDWLASWHLALEFW